eukprot:13168_1
MDWSKVRWEDEEKDEEKDIVLLDETPTTKSTDSVPVIKAPRPRKRKINPNADSHLPPRKKNKHMNKKVTKKTETSYLPKETLKIVHQNVHKYMLKKAKQLNTLDNFSGYSGDSCSVKKVGMADAAADVRNKLELIPNNIKPGSFGVDASSEFSDPLLNVRTVAYTQFEGMIDETGKIYRTGDRHRLEYAVTGPVFEFKANAADMKNAEFMFHASEDICEEEERLLLHKPANDDLAALPLKLRLEFLRFQLRMRLVQLLK